MNLPYNVLTINLAKCASVKVPAKRFIGDDDAIVNACGTFSVCDSTFRS